MLLTHGDSWEGGGPVQVARVGRVADLHAQLHHRLHHQVYANDWRDYYQQPE